jgi:hypothetical protein
VAGLGVDSAKVVGLDLVFDLRALVDMGVLPSVAGVFLHPDYQCFALSLLSGLRSAPVLTSVDLQFRHLMASFALASRALSIAGGLLACGETADFLRCHYNVVRCSLAGAVLPRPTVVQLERLPSLVLVVLSSTLSLLSVQLQVWPRSNLVLVSLVALR